MSKVQLTLEAASPGGRVRKRAYDVATTPPDESAADRAKRKSANRNSALRARKALAQMLTEEPPPSTAPPVALDLVPPSTDQKRSRRQLPGVRRGSKLAKKSLLEQSAALDLADAMGCDPDEVDEYIGDPDEVDEYIGEDDGGEHMGCSVDDTDTLRDDEHRQVAAAVDRLNTQHTEYDAHELHGHGSERLAQLEVLLSPAAWEPVVGREMLWREHRLLLLAQPLLRSYLVPPADISESAAYWEPPPCALCGRAVWPDSASGCYMHSCDRCTKADSERHTRQEQEWRQQEYQRRMREKRRCYGADPGHVRKSGAPPSAHNCAMPPPASYERKTYFGHATTTATTRSATATTLPPPPPQSRRHRHRHRRHIATTTAHERFKDAEARGDANAAAEAMANILGLPREALSVEFS